MTDQVSISTATQGASIAGTKAQAGGKGAGFLGMLMAAIGHKPMTDTSAQTSGSAKTSQDMAGSLASTQDKNAKAAALLLAAAGNQSAQQAKDKHGSPVATSTQDKNARATALLLAAAGNQSAQQAKDKHGSPVAASTQDKNAKAAALLLAAAGNQNAQQAKNEAGRAEMAKHRHAKGQHHQAGGQPTDAAGTDAAASTAASMLQSATAMAPAQPAAQTTAKASESNGHAQERASMSPTGSAAHSRPMAAAGTPNHPASAIPSAAATTPDAPAPSKAAMAAQVASASAATGPMAAAKPEATAGQPAVDLAAAGMQAETQNGKDGAGIAAKASSHAQARAKLSTTQPAGPDHGNTGISANRTILHPQDAVAANGHAGSSGGPGGTAALASRSQAGIQSYTQAAGGPARPLPAQATLIAHADRSTNARVDAAAGALQTPGQDPTAGNMAGTPGIAMNTQAMTNPQAPTPQAPVHTSGPWTAMAAMAEIGQAAANGHSRLELKLEPAHLGKVHVRIDSDGRKNIQVHLVVEQAGSSQIIEQQLPNLRHALEQQGLNLGNFSMSSQQQGHGQGSGQPGQQQAMTASIPGFHGAQATMPQTISAPGESQSAGRLSIRI